LLRSSPFSSNGVIDYYTNHELTLPSFNHHFIRCSLINHSSFDPFTLESNSGCASVPRTIIYPVGFIIDFSHPWFCNHMVLDNNT